MLRNTVFPPLRKNITEPSIFPVHWQHFAYWWYWWYFLCFIFVDAHQQAVNTIFEFQSVPLSHLKQELCKSMETLAANK